MSFLGGVVRIVAALVAVVSAAPIAVAAQDQPAPLDLATLFPATPAGFQPLPDQPGRLGPLDAPAAAAVLDQSGRVTASMLTDAGFRSGFSKAWGRQDTQDVIIDVLLEFRTQSEAENFTKGFLRGRRQTTKVFDLPVEGASGFERGPATPSRATPAQREVVLQRGRVMAIVVVAGFAAYPTPETAVSVAEAQRAALASVPVDEEKVDDGTRVTQLGFVSFVLLAVVTWWLVSALKENPVVAARSRPW